jgi:hypothetical protein
MTNKLPRAVFATAEYGHDDITDRVEMRIAYQAPNLSSLTRSPWYSLRPVDARNLIVALQQQLDLLAQKQAQQDQAKPKH